MGLGVYLRFIDTKPFVNFLIFLPFLYLMNSWSPSPPFFILICFVCKSVSGPLEPSNQSPYFWFDGPPTFEALFFGPYSSRSPQNRALKFILAENDTRVHLPSSFLSSCSMPNSAVSTYTCGPTARGLQLLDGARKKRERERES